MKKNFLLTLALCAALPGFADLNGNGFYRVQNYKTNRYVSVVDNYGSVDYVATSADLQAITLNNNFDVVCGDAASVLYIEHISGKEYNISAQGTGIHKIISHYASLEDAGSSNGQKLYMAFGKYNGVTRYLGDGNVMGGYYGEMSVTTTGDYRKWYIKPIDNSGDNYFGAVATASANAGEYQGLYTDLYTSFPYSAYSDGLKFYTVDKVGEWGGVTLKKVEGIVPENTPVIVKCVGESASDNRLNPGGSAAAVTPNAAVVGVFFNCDKGGKHNNRVAYDADTMRVLGVCADGSLGFVQKDLEYIPANTMYLKVAAGSPAEFKCINDEEFEVKAGVDDFEADANGKTVYTITGLKVADNMSADEIRNLPAGLYIIAGKKVIIR